MPVGEHGWYPGPVGDAPLPAALPFTYFATKGGGARRVHLT